MTGSLFRRALLAVMGLALGLSAAQAADRPFDHDWRTGVTVAPGAMTWTDDNLQNKEALIREIATARGKTCTHDAFLGWPPGSGGGSVILPQTRKNYEAAGYTVEEKPGDLPTDTIWTVASPDREAMILWGSFSGSTIYMSCLTAGGPAPSAEKSLYVGVLLALGLAGLLGGLWLIRRVRALGAASLAWPSTAGTVKTSSVEAYRTQGGKQYKAKVAYDYAVNGAPYSGNRVRFGHRAGALARRKPTWPSMQRGRPSRFATIQLSHRRRRWKAEKAASVSAVSCWRSWAPAPLPWPSSSPPERGCQRCRQRRPRRT